VGEGIAVSAAERAAITAERRNDRAIVSVIEQTD
jgi:hypothetical protein